MDAHHSIYMDQVKAERRFASCVLADPDGAQRTCGWLSPDIFRDRQIGSFWRAVLEGKEAINSATVSGAYDDIMKESSNTPILSRPEEFASTISDLAYMSSQLESARNVARAVNKRNILEVQKTVESMQNGQQVDSGYDMSASVVNQEFVDMLDRGNVAVRTGITDIDSKIGGVYKDEITLLASRPGVGKSALAFYIAWNSAKLRQKTLLFTLEMDRRLAWARMACSFGTVEWEKVRRGQATKDEIDQLKLEGEGLARTVGNYLLIHGDAYSVHEIHRIASKEHPDLVIIDQLPEIRWHDSRASKVDWYGDAVKYLRDRVSKELHSAQLLITQINRAVEERQNKRPTLADLRSSGELEQRGDTIWLAYRDDVYNPGDISGRPDVVPFEIEVAKNRMGKSKVCVILPYHLARQTFS